MARRTTCDLIQFCLQPPFSGQVHTKLKLTHLLLPHICVSELSQQCEISIKVKQSSFTKRHLKISFAEWREFCSGGDELWVNTDDYDVHIICGIWLFMRISISMPVSRNTCDVRSSMNNSITENSMVSNYFILSPTNPETKKAQGPPWPTQISQSRFYGMD